MFHVPCLLFLEFWDIPYVLDPLQLNLLLSISLWLPPLTIFNHHYHVPLCANVMQYIFKIETWLRSFPCNDFKFVWPKCSQQNDV